MISTVITKITVARAFISGVIPVFIFVYILIARVFTEGPVVNIDITTSSNDIANDNNNPDAIPGNIYGNVTSLKVSNSLAPRSLAASSSDKSIPISLALTIRKT